MTRVGLEHRRQRPARGAARRRLLGHRLLGLGGAQGLHGAARRSDGTAGCPPRAVRDASTPRGRRSAGGPRARTPSAPTSPRCAVDADTGEVRVRRLLGRVRRRAHPQLPYGPLPVHRRHDDGPGHGAAPRSSVLDPAFGDFAKHDLASLPRAVHADVPRDPGALDRRGRPAPQPHGQQGHRRDRHRRARRRRSATPCATPPASGCATCRSARTNCCRTCRDSPGARLPSRRGLLRYLPHDRGDSPVIAPRGGARCSRDSRTSCCAATSSTSRSRSSSAQRSAASSRRSPTTSSAALIGVIGGAPDFGGAGVSDSTAAEFVIGSTINALINFVIVAAVVYFVVVVPVNRLMARRRQGARARRRRRRRRTSPLLMEIRDLLKARGGQV